MSEANLKPRKRDKLASFLARSPGTARHSASAATEAVAGGRSASASQVELSLEGGERGVYGIDDTGETELHKAARTEGRQGLRAVRALLKKGAELQARDFEGRTPLHAAAEAGSWRVCLELVARGADVKALAKDNAVPLNMMAKGRFQPSYYALQAFVTLLGPSAILMGHPIYKLDRRRESPLHQACARGRTWLVLAFLSNGADVNCSTEAGDTPLHYAIGTNNLEVAKILLENEADVYAKDKKGRTCFSLLSQKEDWKEQLKDLLPDDALSCSRSRRSMMMDSDDSAVLSLALGVRSTLSSEQEVRETPGLQEAAAKLDQLIHVLATRFSEEQDKRAERRKKKKSKSGSRSSTTADDDFELSDEEDDEEASSLNLATLKPVQELVTSEERLLTFLEKAQMVYMDKIEAASFLKDDEKQLLLSNFQLIYNTFASVSRKLADYLRGAKEDPAVSLAATLRQLPTYLKYVKPYCRTFEEVNDKIQELMITNPKFARLQQEGLDLLGQKLEVLLIMPVQRVMRYPMMLEAILDAVPGTHAEFAGINAVLADFKSLAMMIDEDQELSKRRRQVRDVMLDVGGIEFELVQAARVLLYQGTVEIALKDDTTTARQLYLFNDLLLLAKASDDLSGSGGKSKKKKKQFVLESSFSLANAFVLLLPDIDEDSIYQFAIQFCHQDKLGNSASFTLVSRSLSVRDALLEKLQEALATMNNKSATQVSLIDKSESMFASIEGTMRVMKGSKVAKAYAKLQGKNLFLYRHKTAVKWVEKIALCDYRDITPDVARRTILLAPVAEDDIDGHVKLAFGSSVEFTEWMIEISKQLFSRQTTARPRGGTMVRKK